MIPQHSLPEASEHSPAGFVLETRTQQWVIPESCELLKMLLNQQNIHPQDLRFHSDNQCKRFIKKLFLLAIEDERRTHSPSSLARFGRELIRQTTQFDS
ncbi:MAG: hypothetical protein AAF431_13780 [Pseudomonadota bacterium]